MPDCPTDGIPCRLKDAEEAIAQLLESVGHPPVSVTFGPAANSFNAGTQVLHIHTYDIPVIPSPEVVTVADAAARSALAPLKLNQLLVQQADATNGANSIWVATGLSAGSWGLKVGTLGAQNANAVNITGGIVANITDLSIADGGTGASTAAAARVNLAVATGSVVASNIDWAVSNNFYELLSSNTVFTFSNAADGLSITIAVNNSTGFTLGWPAGVEWVGGTAPTPSGASTTDVYTLIQIGGVIYGTAVQNFLTP